MKTCILFLCMLPIFSYSQEKMAECRGIQIVKRMTGNSNLILTDTSIILKDFLNNCNVKDFFRVVEESNHSFVNTQGLIFYKGQLFLQRSNRYNLFDSICVDFVYDNVLKYRWMEKKRLSKTYRILFTVIYDAENKKINIEFQEMTTKPFLPIFKVECLLNKDS